MLKVIQANPDLPKSRQRHKVYSTKTFTEIKDSLQALENDGKLTVTFSGNMADLAKLPMEQLDVSQRDAVLWWKNRRKTELASEFS